MDIQKDIAAIVKVEKELVAGEIDLNDTPARYTAFLARLRPIFNASSRYLAYSSDLGESFRPIVPPAFVTATYGVSILYLVGDVSYEGYKSNKLAKEYSPENQATVVGITVAKRALFQGFASMLGPAITIHSVVKYSAKAIHNSTRPIFMKSSVRAWLPTFLGLSVVPALPYIFDEPVEHIVEKVFDWGEEQFVHDGSIKKALKGRL